jgi:hypothetical protein
MTVPLVLIGAPIVARRQVKVVAAVCALALVVWCVASSYFGGLVFLITFPAVVLSFFIPKRR